MIFYCITNFSLRKIHNRFVCICLNKNSFVSVIAIKIFVSGESIDDTLQMFQFIYKIDQEICLKKMSIARASDSSGVIQKDIGEFAIADYISNLNKEQYVIKFGDDNCMSSCICYNWRRTSYPCKHLFLIFEKFPV